MGYWGGRQAKEPPPTEKKREVRTIAIALARQAGSPKGAQAVLTKLVWENMKTRCATSRQRLLSRLTTVGPPKLQGTSLPT
jgi:hypothetical protein